MSEAQTNTDPRKALLEEIVAKVPDPQPDAMSYGWAKLELLGHRVLFGYVDQVEFAGARLLRVWAPDENYVMQELGRYTVGAMYGCTPLSKAQAVSQCQWVQTSLSEAWNAARALPERGEAPSSAEAECDSCGAPVDEPCAEDCPNRDDDSSYLEHRP